MMKWWRLPKSAVSKSACAIWSDYSAAKPWRSRSSRRRSILRGQKTDLAVALAAAGRYPVKTVSTTLGVARSNILERRDGERPRRGLAVRSAARQSLRHIARFRSGMLTAFLTY
jgi:hypothetical protein